MLKMVMNAEGLTAWEHKPRGLQIVVTKEAEEMLIIFDNKMNLCARVADGRIDFLKGCPRDLFHALVSLCDGNDAEGLAGFTPITVT